jgi:hypothetical protein
VDKKPFGAPGPCCGVLSSQVEEASSIMDTTSVRVRIDLVAMCSSADEHPGRQALRT